MRNSFIIKNADPSFDAYFNQMKKRKLGNFNQSTTSVEALYGKMPGKRPAARDGHSSLILGDYILIFGGDRHHMPFNDCFCLDLKREFI
jgi:hypothetical protein